MYGVKQKNPLSVVERATHNRFCGRNLLKQKGKLFSKKSEGSKTLAMQDIVYSNC